MIVQQINSEPNPDQVYSALWNRYLKRCNELQKEHRFKEALDIYIEMVKKLCIRYHVELNYDIVSKFALEQ